MPRARILLVLCMLLVAPLVASPARASDPLVVDAGDSAITYGAPLALAGALHGGLAPYAVSWSWPGVGRIADPEALATSFDAAGLAPQDVVFTLTVTDAAGAIASDTVRHRVDAAPVLVRRNVVVTFGLPEELVTESIDVKPSFFTPPAGLARLIATLSWPEATPANDLDLELEDPSGAIVSGGQGSTSRNPEAVAVDAPAPGRWTARVVPFLSAPTNATLVVQGFPRGPLPSITAGGPYAFGRLDAQSLASSISGGTAPFHVAWDTDGDGHFELVGANVTSALPAGLHRLRVRATDAVGFEVSTSVVVDVRPSDTILRLRCGNDPTTPFWAMEFTSTNGTCWIHGGHHTYFTGDARYALRALTGFVFTVEQQFSPPTEHRTDAPGATPLHLQVSEDGLSWSELAHGEYRFLPDVAQGDTQVQQRQRVDIVARAAGTPFRYVRLHEPLSAAQGLSGYLDHSQFDIEADVLPLAAPPPGVPGERAFACENDILEDFFLAHPCWFGGIDRYDAASFWHTYVLGDGATLTRVRGDFTLAPWRADDWTQGAPLAQAPNTSARIQTSVDGVRWNDIARVETTYGAPTAFDVVVEDEPARFVRLFPEHHARFDQTAEFAPNHHANGYFLDSGLLLDGTFAPG